MAYFKNYNGIVLAGSIAFIFKDYIFDNIIFGPKDPNFITYRILCNISNFIGLNDSFCITELPFRIQSRTVSGQFSAHIMTSIAAGFVISFLCIVSILELYKSLVFTVMRKSMLEDLFLCQVYYFLWCIIWILCSMSTVNQLFGKLYRESRSF